MDLHSNIRISKYIITGLKNGTDVTNLISDLNFYYLRLGRIDCPMEWAIKKKDIQLMSQLINCRFNVDSLDKYKENVIFLACRKNFLDGVDELLKIENCNYLQINDIGQSAFFQCVKKHQMRMSTVYTERSDYSSIMLKIISHAKIDFMSSVLEIKYWNIIEAIITNNSPVLKQELKSVDDCDFRALSFESPISIALLVKNCDAVNLLLDKHGDINNCNNGKWNILTEVLKKEDTQLLQFSIVKGIDLNPNNGARPLQQALHNTEYLRILLNKGSDPNTLDEDGDPVIFAAIESIEIITLFLEHGFNSRICDRAGNTLLHHAVEHLPYIFLDNGDIYYQYGIIELLLQYGFNVNAVNSLKQTPIMIAAELQTVDLIELLCEHGANLNSLDLYGRSILNYAVQNQKSNVLRKVLQFGVPLDVLDISGNISLHCKNYNSEFEISCIKALDLLVYGSDMNAINFKGQSPQPYIKHDKSHQNDGICPLYTFFKKAAFLGMEFPKTTVEWINIYVDNYDPLHDEVYYHDLQSVKLWAEELEEMKEIFLTSNFNRISVHEFLYFFNCESESDRRAIFPRISMNNEILQNMEPNFSEMFPELGILLKFTLEIGRRRFNLINDAVHAFGEIIHNGLPSELIEDIFANLSNTCINKFINA